MSEKHIKLKLLETCEELAEQCRDNWEFQETCPMGGIFKCPFFGAEQHCYAITAEMWEVACTQDEDE